MHRRGFVVLGFLVACGGGSGDDIAAIDASIDGAGGCPITGTANVNGTVAGETVSPVTAAHVLPGPPWEIGILENGGTCTDTAGSGQLLDFQFCGEPTVGPHTIIAFNDMKCPTLDGSAGFINEDTQGIVDAVSGTLTITALGACTTGTYDLTFPDGDHLTGDFNAAACPP